MEAGILKTVGQVAGIGGIALGVFLLLFREIIRKSIFPTLTKAQAYRLLTLSAVLIWTVAVAGIGAWVWVETRQPAAVEGRGAVVAGRDINARDIIVKQGLTAEEFRTHVRELRESDAPLVEELKELAKQLGVTESAVHNFFRILGERGVPTERLADRLAEIAERHKALLARLQAFDADDPEIQALQEQARAAIEEGAYRRAEALLGQIREAELAAARRLQEATNERLLNAAAATAEQGEVRLVRLDYAGAAELFGQAADLVPASSPLIHADYLNRLGGVYTELAEYESAERVLREALEIITNNLGKSHSDLWLILNNLGRLYWIVDDFERAEKFFSDAVDIIDRDLKKGAEAPTQIKLRKATVLNNRAGLLWSKEKYIDAASDYRQAVAILEEVFGPEHMSLATPLQNLAHSYQKLGRYEDAEAAYERALDIFEDELVHDHPALGVIYSNLGGFYRERGLQEKAKKQYEKALQILAGDEEGQIGDKEQHPSAGTVYNNLAGLYKEQGDFKEAEKYYIRALQIYKDVFGCKHARTQVILANFEKLLQDHQRQTDAVPPCSSSDPGEVTSAQ